MVQEHLNLISGHLKAKPDKNMAFGQYVGLALNDMPKREQDQKKLKIMAILHEEFDDE